MKSAPASFSVNNKNSTTPKKIPRPMNCFMTYRVEKQQQIVDQCPGANHRDISKIVAKWWRELPADEKEPYRIRAAKVKADHLALYPEYKYCPKKKASKPRAYKKRPENEFTARDFENKHQLFSLYHDGKLPDPSVPRIVNDNEFILDSKPLKRATKVTAELDKEEYPSPSSIYPSYNDSPTSLNHSLQYTPSNYSTGLLYPPSVNSVFLNSSPVPSQSIYSPLTSPYSTEFHYGAEDPININESNVNYQLYPEYGYVQSDPATVSYSAPFQFNATDEYYIYENTSLYTNQSNCRPMDTQNISLNAFSEEPNSSMLTTQFYYP